MKAKINGSWADVPCVTVPNNDATDAKRQLRTLLDRLYNVRSAYSTLSRKLAPLSATDPAIKKAFSKSGMGYATQGGCTDGTYLYFYVKARSEAENGTLVKLKLSDFSTVKTAQLGLYHGNDMTYNPDTGLLYVATMYRSGDTSRVDIINPETLTKIDSKYVPMYISALAYEPTRRLFIGAAGGTLNKYLLHLNDAGDFIHVGTITESQSPSVSDDAWSSQGITCDSAFIYHIFTYTSTRIEIFNWNGDYMGTISKTITYSGNTMEAEFIDKLGRTDFIIGTYGGSGSDVAPIYTFSVT